VLLDIEQCGKHHHNAYGLRSPLPWLSAFAGSSGVQEVSAWHDHARPPRPTSLHFAVERGK